MSDNPYWVGLVMALSHYPGAQALARRAQEQERRERLTSRTESGREGVLEGHIVTVQQAQALSKALEETKRQWDRGPLFTLPRPIGKAPGRPQVPVGECTGDGKVTFLLRADLEGELNTGLEVRTKQYLAIDVQGNCRLSPTLLTNPGGIEIKREGKVRGNPIMRPDATYPDVPCGSVVALVGGSHWAVRGHWEGVTQDFGVLRLAINDVPGHYKDNRAPGGEIVVLAVTVEV